MLNREIFLDPAHPENALPAIAMGANSAGKIIFTNVPPGTTSITVLITYAQDNYSLEFTATSNENEWTLHVAEGVLTRVGRAIYEVRLQVGENYWSGRGVLQALNATSSGIIPEPSDPSEGRVAVLSVNGEKPGKDGNIEISLDELVGQLAIRTAEETAKEIADENREISAQMAKQVEEAKTAAEGSKTASEEAQAAAYTSQDSALKSAQRASASEKNASTSATNAKASEEKAKKSESNAEASATQANTAQVAAEAARDELKDWTNTIIVKGEDWVDIDNAVSKFLGIPPEPYTLADEELDTLNGEVEQ